MDRYSKLKNKCNVLPEGVLNRDKMRKEWKKL